MHGLWMIFVVVEWRNPPLSGKDFAIVRQMSRTAEIAHYSRCGVFRVKAIPRFFSECGIRELASGRDGYGWLLRSAKHNPDCARLVPWPKVDNVLFTRKCTSIWLPNMFEYNTGILLCLPAVLFLKAVELRF